MPDIAVPITQIAALIGGELVGDRTLVIRGLKPLADAGPADLSFLDNEKYLPQFESTRAGAVIVGPSIDAGGKTIVKVAAPYAAFARVLQSLASAPPCPFEGVSPQAFVAPDAALGDGVRIAPGAFVAAGASIGARTRIWPGVSVGPRSHIGADCTINPNVTIYHECIIGDRVTIHGGAVIGGDGFGFAPAGEKYVKIPQIGNVVIEDDVEIGANTTIDRAALGTTRIRRGAKIDNLVMIAHNCDVGEDSIIVAQVGISGSTVLGRHVVLAGQVGVCGHIKLGDFVRVGAQSGVTKSIPDGEEVLGAPAIPVNEFKRLTAHMRKLPELHDRIKEIEKRLSDLEKPKEA